jgi:hypothetical protein
VTVAFCLPTRVFEALALALAERSPMDSSPEGRAETGAARNGMSPLKLGMGEIKLFKACI